MHTEKNFSYPGDVEGNCLKEKKRKKVGDNPSSHLDLSKL